MAKEEYIPLTVEVIKDWTAQEAEQKLVEKEIYVEQKLIPELRYELAVREMQERKIERMESEIDVMNLASEFFLQIKDGKFEKAYNCFALHTPGVSAELTGEGIYEGPEKLKEYYAVYFEQLAGGEGRFYRTDLTSPVIEVAQDNRTARGMWISHTMEALKRDDLKDMPDPLCLWSFCPICMDFVKEDEEWKIWHLYRFDDVKTDFDRSWSESLVSGIPADPARPQPSHKSDRYNPFAADRTPYLQAVPPEPYRTYDETAGF